MPVLQFEYEMQLQYTLPPAKSFFTLKCIPATDKRQRLLHNSLDLVPASSYETGKDSFGNEQIYGCILKPHKTFLLRMRGDVETWDSPRVEEASSLSSGFYKYPYGKCIPWPEANSLLEKLSPISYRNTFERCMILLHRIHDQLTYQKHVTNVNTGAKEAWKMGGGVCQDYAHIYITLLRLMGIPARYVCGFITGEGESHAWVEALCEGTWIGLDPTLDRALSYQYVKLGHGRDAGDCSINRGLLMGGGNQHQQVFVKMWENPQNQGED